MNAPYEERPEPPRVIAPEPARRSRVGKHKMPKTVEEDLPPLSGNKDMTVAVKHFDAHTQGENNDWLYVRGFPHDLRAGGWVYLRKDGVLGRRVRATGIGWREQRLEHRPKAKKDRGPGPTLELDASSWEEIDFPLEEDDSAGTGVRYLATGADGTIRHLPPGSRLPIGYAVDPPA